MLRAGATARTFVRRSRAVSANALQGSCVNPSKIANANRAPFESMIGIMGQTPVLSLNQITSKVGSFSGATPPELMVKLESTNPGWSVKARPALNMLEEAEKRGDIRPGSVIIESSSGNTAIALAMLCSMKGYHFKPVVDVKMPQGKLDLLRVFGADVQIVGDPTIPPELQDMVQLKKDRRDTVARLVEEHGEEGYSPNQYANPDNAGAHIKSTGPELLEQVGGQLDALILPVSTGGQIDGIGRFIKEHLPECVLIGTEPIGSTIFADDATAGSYYNAGSGLDYTPKPVELMLKDGLIDEAWIVPDECSFQASRVCAKYTGALCGPTTGMQLFAALALAIERPELKRIAFIGCDDGRAYLTDLMMAKQPEALDTVEELEEQVLLFNRIRNERGLGITIADVAEGEAAHA